MDYLVFKPGYQTEFLREVKGKTNKTWIELAKELDVCKAMIHFLLTEKHSIREEFFLKLCKISGINPLKFTNSILQKIKKSNSDVKIPENTTKELAELIGIYLGDGHIYQEGLTITCGKIDENFITKYIPNLIKNLFNKKASIYYPKRSKAIVCRAYSRDIIKYFENKFKLKLGRKTNPEIPKNIFKDKELLKSCIRGLIDTDGGIYRHHKNNLQIIFFNSKLSLIYSLKNALESLTFHPRIGKNHTRYCLYLFGKEVIKYQKEIGFSNSKNKVKFNYWLKYNRIPLNKEIECVSRDSNPDLNVGNV